MLCEHVLDSVLGGGHALLCLDQTNIGRHGMMFLNFDLVVSQ
jgi:hypothetical protein